MTAKIIANLKKAKEIVAGYAPELFNLQEFVHGTVGECGTIYCTAGLLSQSMYFKRLGMKYDSLRDTVMVRSKADPTKLANIASEQADADELFGKYSWARLFVPRGHGEWDKQLFDQINQGMFAPVCTTDKELALARIDRQIQELENDT